MAEARQMLLVEPEAMLRRTVALTARSLGVAEVQEAASAELARQLLREQRFDGALIDIDAGDAYDLSLLDQVRDGRTASARDMPLAVMAAHCDEALLASLLARGIHRIVLKPFRARTLLDTISTLTTG